MADELYVVARISQTKADIAQLSKDLQTISSGNEFSLKISPRLYTQGKGTEELKSDLSLLENRNYMQLKLAPRINLGAEGLKGLKKDIQKLCDKNFVLKMKAQITDVEYGGKPPQQSGGTKKRSSKQNISGFGAGEKDITKYISGVKSRQVNRDKIDIRDGSRLNSKTTSKYDKALKNAEDRVIQQAVSLAEGADIDYRNEAKYLSKVDQEAKNLDATLKQRRDDVANYLKALRRQVSDIDVAEVDGRVAQPTKLTQQKKKKLAQIAIGESYLSSGANPNISSKVVGKFKNYAEDSLAFDYIAQPDSSAYKKYQKQLRAAKASRDKLTSKYGNDIDTESFIALDKKIDEANNRERQIKSHIAQGKESRIDYEQENKLFAEIRSEAAKTETELGNRVKKMQSYIETLRKQLTQLDELSGNKLVTQQNDYAETRQNLQERINRGEAMFSQGSNAAISQNDLNQYKQLSTNQKNLQFISHAKEINNNAKEYEGLISQVDRYYKANTKLSQSPAMMERFAALRKSIISCEKPLSELRYDLKKFQNDAKSYDLTGMTVVDEVASKAKRFTEWFGVSQVIMRAVMEVQKMFFAVKEVDSAMVELKKVTNETKATYSSFLDTSISKAKELGSSVSDLINATADFARLGLTT